MMFTGIVLIIDRAIDKDELRNCLAALLAMHPARIVVIHDIIDYPEREDADLVCVLTATTGEFSQILSIQCETINIAYSNSETLVRAFCTRLSVRCLMPVEHPDPYVMWLVTPHAQAKKVVLNVSSFDNGRYEIDRERSNQILRHPCGEG